MRREDATTLTTHFYRLHTSIKPVVDTSPPLSMFSSPKSTFYQPFAMRKQAKSTDSHQLNRRKGQEELAHFLALKRTRSQSKLGFNSFARLKTESCLNLSELDKPDVRSKLLDSRNYQPPLRLRLHSGDSQSPSSSNTSASPANKKIERSEKLEKVNVNPIRVNQLNKAQVIHNQQFEDDVYDQFKDRVLSEILLRNVYTNRVIEDCFRREIAKHPELQQNILLEIMSDTLIELGVKERKKAKSPSKPRYTTTQKHVTISAEAKQKMRSTSLSSGSQTPSFPTSSTPQTSSSNSPFKSEERSSGNQLTLDKDKVTRQSSSSGQNFRIDVSPPRTVSSLSSDIDEIVRRLSNTESLQDIPQKESSISSFEDSESSESIVDKNEQLNRVIERARRKI